MTVDTTVLLSLVMLAAASFAVGVAGWVLLVRDRRALRGTRAEGHAPAAHVEES